MSKYCLYIILGIGLLLSLPAWSGEVSARLNRDTALEGDVVVLSIRAVNLPGNSEPDLSPLEQDFDVLGASNSSQVQIVNGNRTDSRIWQVSLMPKRLGELDIPAVDVGGEKTQPLKLVVKEVPTSVDGSNTQDVILEMELSGDDSPYVQEAVGLTVRILSVYPIRKGNLGRPQSGMAVIEQLGEANSYTTQRNGREYQVVERHYVLFAQQSGELRISPVMFRGSVEMPQTQNQQRRPRSGSMIEEFFGGDPFSNGLFSNSRGKPITIRSNAIKLTIRPAPDSVAAGQWLPAEDVQITDSWLGQTMQPTVGEPLTRTLTVTTKGLSGSQMPDLALPEIASMRSYPDPVQHETKTDGKKVTGTSTQTFTLVPQQAGKVTIPAIDIAWWDTIKDEARTVKVKAVTLDVAQGAAGSAETSVKPPQPVINSKPTDSGTDEPEADSSNQGEVNNNTGVDWRWLLLLTGFIAAVIAFWFRKRSEPQQQDIPETPAVPVSVNTQEATESDPVNQADLKAACLQACRSHDTRLATTTLLDWARAEWRNESPTSLQMLADQLETGAEVVRSLERSVYSGNKEIWDGGELANLLEKGLRRKSGQQDVTARSPSLDPLYPG